ncbi:VWF [Cervus elaphus hippelaphus]|uniref:von Willebrand factor n=1 Tax=Cervus elaphus hippelaphus TaxID=46360 RepID=A0A212CCJ4_CEREH|nr:VWF [Cervus elaphus hippelaphus]
MAEDGTPDHCGSNPGTFRVLVGNEGCSVPSLKCRKRITILVEGGEIELFDGEVNVKKPMKDETHFEVVESGRYITLLLGKSLSVVWDGHLAVSVFLKRTYQSRGKVGGHLAQPPPDTNKTQGLEFASAVSETVAHGRASLPPLLPGTLLLLTQPVCSEERVCGLCGNFDGVQNNDLTSSSLQVEEDPVDFGNSWKVSPQCADTQKVPLDSAPATCHDNVMKQTMVDSSCRVLTSDVFRECNRLNCEERNLKESGYQCEWRYNSCAPACPVTCQHPEPLACPVPCVEGCHAHCPPGEALAPSGDGVEGKILDELLQTCVNPEDCPVCQVEGRRLASGKKVTLNPGDPEHCQICHCDGVSLTCEACREPGGLPVPPTEGPVSPTTPYVEDTPEPPLHDFFCSKLLDLVFLLDGSSKLSEADFETLKAFVVGMMERLHISQKRIRVAVVEYHDGSHAYLALQDRKRPSELRRIAGQVKYAGSEVASTSEVLKYTLFQIFGRIDRPEASRVALLLTASQEPPRLARNLVRYVQGLKKKKVSVVPVGIGPHASVKQIRLIEKQASENKAFVLSGVHELEQRMDEIVGYLCDLAPEVPAPTPTRRPLAAQVTVAPQLLGPLSSGPKRSSVVLDVAFLVEGSDEVGEANFNRSAEFVKEVIRRMDVGRDGIHVTVLQYSYVALSFAVRYITSQVHGARPGASKVVVILVTGSSMDPVEVAAAAARSNRVAVFPIGIGDQYDAAQLRVLAGPGASSNVAELQRIEDLPSMVALGNSFFQKLCSGSSTRHIVTFDGRNFKLTGNCSYVLFHNKEQDLEVILHNGFCSVGARQACMKSVEVKQNGLSVELRSNMEVMVNGRLVSVPYLGGDMEVRVYGTIMFEVRFKLLGHILAFTPQNNEFQLQLSPKISASKTYGLCGFCDENGANDFMLRDGTVTADWKTLVQEWTVQQPGQTCPLGPEEPCPISQGSRCQVLLSELFAECHKVVAPATFHAMCQQDSCHQEQVCEAIASYAHLCLTKGVSVSCPPSLVYNHCESGCPRQCEGNSSSCADHPSEGCFCPPHQVMLEGSCVPEEACTQCVGDDGVRHQASEVSALCPSPGLHSPREKLALGHCSLCSASWSSSCPLRLLASTRLVSVEL